MRRSNGQQGKVCRRRDVGRKSGPDGIPGEIGVFRGNCLAIAGWRCAQYDGIVASAAASFSSAAGGDSMMMVLLIAGIGLLLAGLWRIGFGIPVKEFSFGNTLIIAGAVIACTGVIMLGALDRGSGVEGRRAAARRRCCRRHRARHCRRDRRRMRRRTIRRRK